MHKVFHNISKYLFLILFFLFLFSTMVVAVHFDFGFNKIDKILKEIREKNLSQLEARYYKKMGDEVVQCQLCPRRCTLSSGQKGACGARVNISGKLYTMVYGRPVAVHVDPIEKKPLSHFYPATDAFSIATAGCNLGCIFCQNWQISQARPEEAEHLTLSPEQTVEMAKQYKCKSIAYTYTEPTIFYEYMLDTAKLARKAGIKNVMHSCGYINPEPLKELLQYMDAANIDLKGFSEEFYGEMCKASLSPVLKSIKTIKKAGVWLEITNLIIPTKNDDPKMIREMCLWLKNHVGADVPLYFSAFHPNYQLQNLPPTPIESLEQAHKIAKDVGLNYVYIGNVYGHTQEHTYCPKCGKVVVKREGYSIFENNITKGKCKFCGYKIAGVWE